MRKLPARVGRVKVIPRKGIDVERAPTDLAQAKDPLFDQLSERSRKRIELSVSNFLLRRAR